MLHAQPMYSGGISVNSTSPIHVGLAALLAQGGGLRAHLLFISQLRSGESS